MPHMLLRYRYTLAGFEKLVWKLLCVMQKKHKKKHKKRKKKAKKRLDFWNILWYNNVKIEKQQFNRLKPGEAHKLKGKKYV